VHSSQLAFTSSLQLGGRIVVMSLGGLLVVTSVVVALSAGGIVVSAADEDRKLLELSFSAGVLLLLGNLVFWESRNRRKDPKNKCKTKSLHAGR